MNAVSTGAVVSDPEERVFDGHLQQYNDLILGNQFLKHRIQPGAVPDLVLFLASPGSNLLTGQNIGIDGGW